MDLEPESLATLHARRRRLINHLTLQQSHRHASVNLAVPKGVAVLRRRQRLSYHFLSWPDEVGRAREPSLMPHRIHRGERRCLQRWQLIPGVHRVPLDPERDRIVVLDHLRQRVLPFRVGEVQREQRALLSVHTDLKLPRSISLLQLIVHLEVWQYRFFLLLNQLNWPAGKVMPFVAGGAIFVRSNDDYRARCHWLGAEPVFSHGDVEALPEHILLLRVPCHTGKLLLELSAGGAARSTLSL